MDAIVWAGFVLLVAAIAVRVVVVAFVLSGERFLERQVVEAPPDLWPRQLSSAVDLFPPDAAMDATLASLSRDVVAERVITGEVAAVGSLPRHVEERLDTGGLSHGRLFDVPVRPGPVPEASSFVETFMNEHDLSTVGTEPLWAGTTGQTFTENAAVPWWETDPWVQSLTDDIMESLIRDQR